MRLGKSFQCQVFWFLCCVMMLAFLSIPAHAEARNFSFYSGKAGTLLESADTFVKRMYPDMKKTPQSNEDISSDTASGGYAVVREVPDRMGKAGATRPEDVSVVGVSIQVFKARADHKGAGAEAAALERAQEHFTFLFQEDSQRGIIKEQKVPDKGAKPGAYAYYSYVDGFDRGARALAGNIFISVNMNYSGFKLDRPDPKALIEAILSGLP